MWQDDGWHSGIANTLFSLVEGTSWNLLTNFELELYQKQIRELNFRINTLEGVLVISVTHWLLTIGHANWS